MADYQDMFGQYGGLSAGVAELVACGGRWYVVDPVNGKAGADGTTLKRASTSIEAMYAKLRTNRNDGIFLVPGATGNALAAAMTWSISYSHCVGLGPKLAEGHRCRITGSAALDLSPLVTVSGAANSFTNIQFYNGKDSNSATGGVYVTGARNLFDNCQIIGITNATVGDRSTDVYDLKFYGNASENTFRKCKIGLDTVLRTGALASVIFTADESSIGAARTTFEQCKFTMWCDAANPVFVRVSNNNGIDRYVHFKDCFFINSSQVATGTTLSEAFDIAAGPGGVFLMDNCSLYGATDWEAATVSGFTILNNPIGAVDGGLAKVQTA